MSVTNGEIIELIYKDDSYRGLCKKLAGKDHLAKDLHQEFALALLEINDDRLIRAYTGEDNEGQSYLNVFCVGIINNIWGKRNRVKTYTVGTTSPLFEYTSTFERPNPDREFALSTPTYNIRADYVSTKAEELVKKDWDHPDKNEMYKARVFYYSYFQYKNPKQFSDTSGIPYSTVIKTCNHWRSKLRKMLKIE